MGFHMLRDLYLLQAYFDPPFSVIYEEDLLKRFDEQQLSAAIKKGWLEWRDITPCRPYSPDKKNARVFWLSYKGKSAAGKLRAIR